MFDQWRLEPRSLVTPYNEHLSIIPIGILLVLLETVGLRTHLPYLTLVHAMHILVAAGVFVLVRQTVGRWVAVAVAVLVLAMGAGWENLFWAWQIGAVTSMAAGVWALVVAHRGGAGAGIVAAMLVAIALASSSFGLPMALMTGVFGYLHTRSRSVLLPLAAVGVAYAGWLMFFGSNAPGLCSSAPLEQRAADIPILGVVQVLHAFGALAGWGVVAGAAVAVPALAVLVRARGARPASAVAALVAIVAFGVLIGLARGCLGPSVGGASRYLYVSGILAAIVLAGTLGRFLVSHDTRHARALAATAVLVAVAGGGLSALHWRDGFVFASSAVRAAVTIGLSHPECRTPEATDEFSGLLALVPDGHRLAELVGRYGDPRRDILVPWTSEPDPALLARVESLMCE